MAPALSAVDRRTLPPARASVPDLWRRRRLDRGLLFVCFQRDVDRRVVTTRSVSSAKHSSYLRPVGGGFSFARPGVRNGVRLFGRRQVGKGAAAIGTLIRTYVAQYPG